MTSKQGIDPEVLRRFRHHIEAFWRPADVAEERLSVGPIDTSLPGFRVLRLRPCANGSPWIYCTLGASTADQDVHERHEFFLISPTEDFTNVETLTMLANFHADPKYRLTVGRVVSIGQPWLDQSSCDHLLISLPYPYGPKLEWLTLEGCCIRLLWALPITQREAGFAELHGYQELEKIFEEAGINYLEINRSSVV